MKRGTADAEAILSRFTKSGANDFAWYGKGGEIAVNNREDQEIAILSLHLLQICMVYINTLLVQKVLEEEEWLERMQRRISGADTTVLWPHFALRRVSPRYE